MCTNSRMLVFVFLIGFAATAPRPVDFDEWGRKIKDFGRKVMPAVRGTCGLVNDFSSNNDQLQRRNNIPLQNYPFFIPQYNPQSPPFNPQSPPFNPQSPPFNPQFPQFNPQYPQFNPQYPQFNPQYPRFSPPSNQSPQSPKDNREITKIPVSTTTTSQASSEPSVLPQTEPEIQNPSNPQSSQDAVEPTVVSEVEPRIQSSPDDLEPIVTSQDNALLQSAPDTALEALTQRLATENQL